MAVDSNDETCTQFGDNVPIAIQNERTVDEPCVFAVRVVDRMAEVRHETGFAV